MEVCLKIFVRKGDITNMTLHEETWKQVGK
jgi:hypothetical protein